ncbi:MAG: CPBP family intramembrane glutamic endopeptidase [Ktedonobacteraceae bacterium]
MKNTGYVLFLFLFPLVVAGLFAVPAYLLHAYAWLSVLIYLGEIAGTLYLMQRKRSTIDFGVSPKGSWPDGVWCVLYILLRTAVWVVLIPIVAIQTNWLILLPQALSFFLLTAPAEELHFRGLLFSSIEQLPSRKKMALSSVLVAACVSSFLFAVLHMATHFSAGWLWLVVFMGDGLAFCALRIKTGSLLTPFIAHAVVNILTGELLISATTVADNIALLYQVTVILIDLLFFVVVLSQSKLQAQVREKPEPAMASQHGGIV